MARGKLNNDVKTFIVQSLACSDSPTVVAAAVRKEFGIIISRQLVEKYDPAKPAGRALSPRWCAIYQAMRCKYLNEIANIGIAHLSVRLKILERLYYKAEEQGNLELALLLLKQAAMDQGGMYTNRREFHR